MDKKPLDKRPPNKRSPNKRPLGYVITYLTAQEKNYWLGLKFIFFHPLLLCCVKYLKYSKDFLCRLSNLFSGLSYVICLRFHYILAYNYHRYRDISMWSSSRKALPGMDVGRSVIGQSIVYITLVSYTPLCYVRNVACKE